MSNKDGFPFNGKYGRHTVVCIDESNTKGRMAPIDSKKRPHVQDIFDQPIPRKSRVTKSDESTQSYSHATSKSTTSGNTTREAKQIEYIINKHGLSKETIYGEAFLFFQVGDQSFLRVVRLNKRCISSSDCIQGRTYMDTTSFSRVLKRNECPLVAYAKNKGPYKRGYLLCLGVRETVIIGLKSDGSFKTTVDKFKPMEMGDTLSIKYINLVDETMDSKHDGFLCSKTSGPDSITIDKLPYEIRRHYESDPTSAILTVPKHLINVSRKQTPTPFNINKIMKPRKNVARVGLTCSISPESNQSIPDELWKDHMAFVSPEDVGGVYFLTRDDAKELINMGVLERTKFLNELRVKSKFRIQCNELEVDKRDGLTLVMADSNNKNVGVPSKCTMRKQNYKYEGDIVAQYTTQKRIEVKDEQGLLFLVHEVLNNTSTTRTCSKNVGIFFNKGTNTSQRPRIDPRKDEETKRESERWTGSTMNGTFAPLLFEIIMKLACFSQDIAKAFDPVVQYAFSKVYEEIIGSDEGKEIMRSGLDRGMNLNSIQIFTFPDRSGRNFANTGHFDRNDNNASIFNKAMDKMLGKAIKDWCGERAKSSNSSQRNEQLDEYFLSLLYLIRLGKGAEMSDGEEGLALQYESETTCGYQPMLLGNEKRQVFCGFLFPKNNVLVRFRVNETTFQRWKSGSMYHLTPVSYTYDEKNVYLKDKNLIILAWGGGTSSKRTDFLSERGIDYDGPTIRGTTQLCNILRDNGATRRSFLAARDRFPNNQQCITTFFRNNYGERSLIEVKAIGLVR